MAIPNKKVKRDFQRLLDYNTDTSTLIRKQAMVNNELLSDVVFLVGPDRQRIYAHKLLLVMSSEYFYIMFFGSFVEASAKEVVLADDDPDVFLLIMRYIYTGEIDLTFENMRNIFDMAQKFMLNDLNTLICDFILRHIDAESTLRLFSENRHYGYTAVDDKCLEMISDNPVFYLNHDDFKNIDSISFDMILSLKQINCTDENLITGVRTWAASRNQPDEVRALCKKIEEGKRTFNCTKLRFFGQCRIEPFPPGELAFTLDSETPVSLYGIGVYIASGSNKFALTLCVYQEDTLIINAVVDGNNDHVNTVKVLTVCFEERMLLPHKRYTIFIWTLNDTYGFGFEKPIVFHDSIKLRFHTRSLEREPCVIAHMLCKENPHHIAE